MKNFLVFLVTCILLVVALEVGLRFLPVDMGLRSSAVPVNNDNPVFHAKPNRDMQFSHLWNFSITNKKHVNNAGFMNKSDYDVTDPRKLVAVVGDSYVEALQVNDDESFYQQLAQNNPDLRIYSFGFSGAALSQYLIWAQYAQENFHNDFLIVSVISNDFDESLKKYKFASGFHYYDENADGSLVLVRSDFEPNQDIIFLLERSHLARYLIFNCRILDVGSLLKQKFSPPQQYVNNVPAQVDPVREQDSYRAIDAFLRDLPQYSGLKPSQILLMTDALRPATYNAADLLEAQKSYAEKMNQYLLVQAKGLGYNILSLQEPFSDHFAIHQQRFEFPTDTHWNALGHQVVVEEIEKTPWWQQTVK